MGLVCVIADFCWNARKHTECQERARGLLVAKYIVGVV